MAYIQLGKIRVSQEVADQIKANSMPQRDLAGLVRNYLSQHTASLQGAVDLQPADGGNSHTQNDWISYFNEFKNPRKRMISAPDVYRLGQNGSQDLLQSVREDFEQSWIVSSTRINYASDTLDAKITHNYGSKVVQPTEIKVAVPVYQQTALSDALKAKEGINYLQALFNTKDDKDQIARTLTALSGKSVENIYVWTPNQQNRASYQERAAGFDFGGGRFHVDGDFRVVDGGGRSRGVSVKSAEPTRKKRR